MSRPSDFKPGARVLWAGTEYEVWSASQRRGRVWITRDGKHPIEALVRNLQLVAAAADAVQPATVGAVTPIRSAHPAPRKISDADRRAITAAIMCDAADHDGVVDPNRVRRALSNDVGLTVPPRAVSTIYSTLAGKGTLRSLGYTGVNDDARGGNAGKPQRQWQWVGPLPAAQAVTA